MEPITAEQPADASMVADVVSASFVPGSTGGDLLRVAAYLRRLGMRDETAITRVCTWLAEQIDPSLTDPAKRTVAALSHFDHWMQELPAALGLGGEVGRVGVASLSQFGPMLDCFAETLDQEHTAEGLAEHLKRCVDRWPRGLLPVCAELDMPRQALGELPAVLRGEFWSGTYRWVLPTARARRQLSEDASR